MSESWANKYRPKSISEVIGQDRVKRELETLNKVGKMPQSIIISGSSGSGKTTLAYLIAKMGKCTQLSNEGVPCRICSQCLSIDKLIEKQTAPLDLEVYLYNISKLNRSEDAEEIVERMSTRNSILLNKRFFILDEIQVASQQAQSRFLKITEEQPKGLFTILCTTNPEKLLEPLRSRFVEYKLTKPKTTDIVDKLAEICVKEGVNYTPTGLALIVKECKRSVRMSINKAQELSAFGDLTKENVSERLSNVSEEMYLTFIDAIERNNLTKISELHNHLEEEDIPLSTFCKGFGSFVVDLIDISNAVHDSIYSPEEVRRYRRIFSRFSTGHILGMLSKSKEYSNEDSTDKFLFYSFSTELMSIFNQEEALLEDSKSVEVVQKEISNLSEASIQEKYRELTRRVEQTAVKTEPVIENVLETEAIVDFFNGSVIE